MRPVVVALALIAFAITPSVAQHPRFDDDAAREGWETTFAEAHQNVSKARRRESEARAAYQNVRHRRRIRGVAKQKILDELDAAQKAVPIAERELDELEQSAHRAGVPPGWRRRNATRTADR